MKANKPFWFAFNTADWLSSKSVRMMSLAERGAYIGLLATAWGEDQPGTLPASEDTVRRLCEMSPADWAVSGPALLDMFPLSECGTYRYNPRLLDEAAKREQLSEKKAEAGRRSAAKREAEANRKAAEAQHNSNNCSTPVENPATGVDEKGNQLQPQLQLHSSKEEDSAVQGGQGASQVKSSTTPTKEAPAAKDREYAYDEVPHLQQTNFYSFVDSIGYSYVDRAMYLVRIESEAREKMITTTLKKWKLFIQRWIDNDKRDGKLLLPDAQTVAKGAYRNQYNPPAQVTRSTMDINAKIAQQQGAPKL